MLIQRLMPLIDTEQQKPYATGCTLQALAGAIYLSTDV